MPNKEYFITNENLQKFAAQLLIGAKVIAPIKFGNNNIIDEITIETVKDINLNGFRTIEPLKSYLFKLIERVSTYFEGDVNPKPEKLVFFGARGCDIEAIEVLDYVYTQGEIKDSFYANNRAELTIIGADCTDCGRTCFCTMVNGKPYPIKMFDLNLTPVKDGYIVEIGTDKGRALIEANPELFEEAAKERANEKVKLRMNVADLLAKNNANYKVKLELKEIHQRNLENKAWKMLTKDCVECSACNFACPTCTCFLLLDQKAGEGGKRDKVWDACLKAGYTRVAGGSNPRGSLFQRLQNRYQCKFDYSHDRLGRYTCVGCGRCIDGCCGNIDMRKIFVELEKQVPLTAKLK